jgi:hypothetical protein
VKDSHLAGREVDGLNVDGREHVLEQRGRKLQVLLA